VNTEHLITWLPWLLGARQQEWGVMQPLPSQTHTARVRVQRFGRSPRVHL